MLHGTRLPFPQRPLWSIAMAGITGLSGVPALAQTQLVKPPIAQYWMDVATISVAGMDDMPDMGALGGLMGGMPGLGSVGFGATHGMMPGRWLDLAVRTQRKPAGAQALQAIPPGQAMGPSLTLLPVKAAPQQPSMPAPRGDTEPDDDAPPQQPKGRILLYWGCSDTVRAGQPKVLDFSKASAADYGRFMMGRAVRDNGAKAIPGHAIWPNAKHQQKIPANASLQGTHTLSGEGLPEGWQFALGAAQDFMPKLAITHQGGGAGATRLRWRALPTAQAYFLSAMSGSDQGDVSEMVIWSASELPEPGWGLLDYASNANVAQWLKEKVLLPPGQTECSIPEGIFAKAESAMLRGIAYGQELNLAHPPRPQNTAIPWTPQWTAKIRVKSVTMVTLGEADAAAAPAEPAETISANPAQAPAPTAEPVAPMAIPDLSGVGKVLKGLLGQ
ncbi:MAG: hypothetical protein Fur007_16410 [Rhodoferax sp.]